MTRFLLSSLCVVLLVGVLPACVSPSLLGATALNCSAEELTRLETLPTLASSEVVADPSKTAAVRELGFKAAVFNIRSGFGPDNDRQPLRVRARLTRIAASLLDAGAPDVIGLNEVDFRSRRTDFMDQAEFIAKQLERAGYDYQVVRGPAWLRDEPGREVRYGNALLVRHPIVQARHCSFAELAQCDASPAIDNLPAASLAAPWSWLSHEPRGVVMADFRWRGRTVRVIVTHLDPFSAQVRETQAAQIIAGLVPPQGPVVLLGDMNTVPTRLTLDRAWFSADRTHDVLTAGRLFDTRSELGGDDASNWKRWATYPANDPRWPLDGVFASVDLESIDLQLIGSGLSDHLGVVAALVPITDTAQLSARIERHAIRRARRLKRLQRCDGPDVGRASFFSWLHDVAAFGEHVEAGVSGNSVPPR